MTSTLIPNFRIFSTNWTVANINFAGQYKSCTRTLITFLKLFLHLTCLIWCFCKRSPQVVTDLIFSLKSFQTKGPPYHVSVKKAILVVGRTCPSRRAFLAHWSFPCVWSWRLTRPSVGKGLHLQHSKRSSWGAVSHPLMAGDTGNSKFILLARNADLFMAIKNVLLVTHCPALLQCVSAAHTKLTGLSLTGPSPLWAPWHSSHTLSQHSDGFGHHHSQKMIWPSPSQPEKAQISGDLSHAPPSRVPGSALGLWPSIIINLWLTAPSFSPSCPSEVCGLILCCDLCWLLSSSFCPAHTGSDIPCCSLLSSLDKLHGDARSFLHFPFSISLYALHRFLELCSLLLHS